MENFNMISRLVCLYFVVLVILDNALASTCTERLEVLEGIVGGLIKGMGTRGADINVNFGNKEDTSINSLLRKEIRDLKKKLTSLEESLTHSNLRTKELVERVSELESSLKSNSRNKTVCCKCSKKNSKMSSIANEVLKQVTYNMTKKNLVSTFNVKSMSHGEAPPFSQSENLSETKPQPIRAARGQESSYSAQIQTEGVNALSGNMTSIHLTQDGVAFSAYVSVHETELSKGYTIHFDTIITNIGSHYNKYSGVFNAPQHGVYVFAWTLYCHAEGYIFSELVVNSDVVGAMVSDGELQGATNIRTATGIVVVAISQGDAVYVRTHPTKDHRHNLYSDPAWRSSFNGWRV